MVVAQVRVVKAWAGARALNDASDGTFNSYALTLLVSPLPPLFPRRMLFGPPDLLS